MDVSAKNRAAGGHLLSGFVALAAFVIGIQWVQGGGEAVAVPATVIILSLVALTPVAVRRSWQSRGEFIDGHVEAACRFLTTVGFVAVVTIGIPAAISPFLTAGTDLWSSLMVLPYLAGLVLPLAWAYFAVRAAFLAFKGAESPFPAWATPEVVAVR